MLAAATLDADHTVRLWKTKGGRYHAAVDGLALFGSGDTMEAAIGELDRRYDELQAFGKETGLALDTFATTRTGATTRWKSTLATAALVVACFGLAMIPLSYALSTALQRSVTNLHLAGGRQFWHDAEQSLLNMADASNAPSPEEQAKIVAALHTVVQRFQPFADEIKPVLGCGRTQ